MLSIRKTLITVLLVLSLAGTIFAGGQQDGAEAVKTANLVYANWEEGIAYTNLAKVVLQDKMGYDVTITASDVAPAYASVAAGDQDAFMETWLPVLHKDYIERYGDDFVDLGHVYEGTLSGLAIPVYMYDAGIKTISDLLKPEANVMPAYGLGDAGYKLLASSGPAMMASLKDRYNSEEWIVVTAWKPHSMFGYFDLVFLEQDKETVWGSGNIHITARKNIKEDKPELAQFLSNMFLTNSEVGSLMVAIRESSKSEEEAAREWLAANEDVVADWIPR